MMRGRRRSEKNNSVMTGRVIAAVLAVAAVVLLVLLFKKDKVTFLKPYEPENQAANISRSFQIDSELFASDLCVITDSAQPEETLEPELP